MRINWMSNSYPQGEGYGRFSAAMILALQRAGVDVMPCLRDHLTMPDWMLALTGVDWRRLTIACMPPYYLPDYPAPGRYWLLTMTEGGALPEGWADFIHEAKVERVIVPCEHNREVFQRELDIPVHVVPGGTEPAEFPLAPAPGNGHYTFLALADRGARKGWTEVWTAFYREFGRPCDTPDVHLVVKARPSVDGDGLLERLAGAENIDPRVTFWIEETEHPSAVWARADCVVIPSRSEGWGMPHREAAMMGRPVLATQYSGLDDGHLHEWAIPLTDYHVEPIELPNDPAINGDWVRVSVDEVARKMRWCFENPEAAACRAKRSAQWLRENQTWDQAATTFVELLEAYG